MRIWAAVIALSTANAATAVLDCIGDGFGAGKRWRGDGAVLRLDARTPVALQFRSTSLKGWRATGAKLMVHVERGRLGGVLLASYSPEFGEATGATGRSTAAVSVRAIEAGAGWWQIEIPAALAQRWADAPDGAILLRLEKGGAAVAIHARESLHFAARVIVEGL